MMRRGCTARATGTLSGGADTHVGRADERPRQLHHLPLLRAPHRTQQLESARLALSKGWYSSPYGQYNYTGGTFQNREGEFPPTRPTTSTTSTRGHGEPRGTATASQSTAP